MLEEASNRICMVLPEPEARTVPGHGGIRFPRWLDEALAREEHTVRITKNREMSSLLGLPLCKRVDFEIGVSVSPCSSFLVLQHNCRSKPQQSWPEHKMYVLAVCPHQWQPNCVTGQVAGNVITVLFMPPRCVSFFSCLHGTSQKL